MPLNGNILTQVMADVFNDQFIESVTKISITNEKLLIEFNHSNHQKQRLFLEWT